MKVNITEIRNLTGEGNKGFTENRAEFETYANYIRGFSFLAGYTQPMCQEDFCYDVLNQNINQTKAYQTLKSISIDLKTIKKSLNNAWATELLLTLAGKIIQSEDFIKIANNWAAIQLYFIFYHATQALHVSRGNVRPTDHPKTIRIFSNEWLRDNKPIPPWTIGIQGNKIFNLPTNISIDSQIKAITYPKDTNSNWSLAIKALRTTGKRISDRQIEIQREQKRIANKKRWLEDENERIKSNKRPRKQPRWTRPLLLPEEKDGIVPLVSIMDFFYRLRKKTQYLDTSTFTEGPSDDFSSRWVYCDITNLGASTMFVFEKFISKIIGKDNFQSIVSDWVKSNRYGYGVTMRNKYLIE